MTAKRKTTKPSSVRKGRARQPAKSKPGESPKHRPSRGRHAPPPTPPDSYWIFGSHAAEEALANPARQVKRVLLADHLTERRGARVDMALSRRPERPPEHPPERPCVERVTRQALDRLLGEDAVHQGVALLVTPLIQPDLEVLVHNLKPGRHVLVALDQVTDPHNVGAVLRSAAAFGARAVLTTRRHAPAEGGVLAKAASGALEHVPYLQEANLARALQQLKHAEFQILGLAEDGDCALPLAAAANERNVLVLGAEGKGLRRLTAEVCDRLIRLPTGGPIGALNVSNAAAVALYELSGVRTGHDSR